MLAMIVKPESKTEVDRYLIFEHFVQFKFQYTCWMLKAEGWTIEQYDWNTVILHAHFPFFRSSESEVWTHLLWCVCIVNILAADANITHQEIHPHWLILAFSKVHTSLWGRNFWYQTCWMFSFNEWCTNVHMSLYQLREKLYFEMFHWKVEVGILFF